MNNINKNLANMITGIGLIAVILFITFCLKDTGPVMIVAIFDRCSYGFDGWSYCKGFKNSFSVGQVS